jgi:hypothetical protein
VNMMTRLHAGDLLLGDEMMSTIVYDEGVQAKASRNHSSEIDDSPQASRIPVYRDGALCGYVARGDKPSTAATFRYRSALPADVWMQLQLTHALRSECWVDTRQVGATVKNSVVHLSGMVDSMHGVLALRRIAAAIPGTTAIIDDLWVPCE